MTNFRISATSAYALAMAIIPASGALAQTDTQVPAADTSAQISEEQSPAIIVTGSRISRPDYQANSPAVTIGVESIQSSGQATIESALNQLPQFSPSFGAASAFPGNGGQANLNLRGLGTNRALILLNGRRLQPSNPDGTIDLNIIPDTMIGGVETLTGGASAAYGSDAVAGVVNFKTRRDVHGVELDAQYGLTDAGDAQNFKVSGNAGFNFADDRGYFVTSATYTERASLLRSARSFFSQSQLLNNLPQGTVNLASNPPSQAAVDAVFGSYGATPGSVSRGLPFGFNMDGTLFTQAPSSTPIINYRDGYDDYIIARNNIIYTNSGPLFSLQLPIQRISSYTFTDFEVSDALRVFAEFNFSDYTAKRYLSAANLGGLGTSISIPVTSPFIPDDLRTLLASRANPNQPINLIKNATFAGNRRYVDDYRVFQATLGASGKLPLEGWTWDGYFAFGKTRYRQDLENSISLSALRTLLNAPDGGASLCEGGINLFGDVPVSPSCTSYVVRTLKNRMDLKQQTGELNTQGNLFALPGGDVKLALGFAYRRNTYSFVPDELLASGNAAGFTRAAAASGEMSVWELYSEVLLPLLADKPFVRELNLSAAYRYSQYNTSGSVSTYKVDGDWVPVDGVRLRGGYQRAVRAPSLSELFASPTAVQVNVGQAVTSSGAPAVTGDPCDVRGAFRNGTNAAQVRALCIAQGIPTSAIDSYTRGVNTVTGITGGNPNLTPEKADTFSAGIVLQPKFGSAALSNLSLSVDYYNIKIDDAIGVLGIANQFTRCFNGDGVSNPSYDPANVNCAYITRDPNGVPIDVLQPLLNQATIQTDGVDFQLDYRLPFDVLGIGETGGLKLNSVVSYVRSFKVQSLPGSPTLDYAGSVGSSINGGSIPDLRATTTLGYYRGKSEISLRWRWINNLVDQSKVANPSSTVPGVPSYHYFDLNGRLAVNDGLTFRLGVTNLTNKKPPVVGGVIGDTEFTLYDVLGRQFYIGASMRF